MWYIITFVLLLYSAASAFSAEQPVASPAFAPMSSAVIAPPAQEAPAPAGAHTGKVLSTRDSGGYTYIEYQEGAETSWVAVMQTAVKIGDLIGFPDSQPMVDFTSKTLEMTFPKIIFAPGLHMADKTYLSIRNEQDEYAYMARRHLEAGNTEAALYEVNEAIRLAPDNAGYYVLRSKINSGGLRFYVEGTNSNVEIRKNNRVLCSNALEDVNTAIGLYETQKNPALEVLLAAAYGERAQVLTNDILCGNKEYSEAIRDYDRALAHTPDDDTLVSAKGFLYDTLHNHSKVLECSKKVLALNPNNPNGYYLQGIYYTSLKQYARAMESLGKGLEMDQEGGGTFYVDEVTKATKRPSDAIKLYSTLLSKHPRRNCLLIARATVYDTMKEYKKAIDDYTAAINLSPESAYLYDARSDSFYKSGDKLSALSDKKEACSLGDQFACPGVPRLEKEIQRGDKWVLVTGTSTTQLFYDKSSVSLKGGYRTAWIRNEVTDKQQYLAELISDALRKKFEDLSYSVAKYEVDCQGRRTKQLSFYGYTEKGSVIDSYEDGNAPFSEVVPQTVGEGIMEAVCKVKIAGKKSKKR